jgi:hypothetical protein
MVSELTDEEARDLRRNYESRAIVRAPPLARSLRPQSIDPSLLDELRVAVTAETEPCRFDRGRPLQSYSK